jgi:hypothetical protein
LLSTGYISRTNDSHYLFEEYTSYSITAYGKIIFLFHLFELHPFFRNTTRAYKYMVYLKETVAKTSASFISSVAACKNSAPAQTVSHIENTKIFT